MLWVEHRIENSYCCARKKIIFTWIKWDKKPIKQLNPLLDTSNTSFGVVYCFGHCVSRKTGCNIIVFRQKTRFSKQGSYPFPVSISNSTKNKAAWKTAWEQHGEIFPVTKTEAEFNWSQLHLQHKVSYLHY